MRIFTGKIGKWTQSKQLLFLTIDYNRCKWIIYSWDKERFYWAKQFGLDWDLINPDDGGYDISHIPQPFILMSPKESTVKKVIELLINDYNK